MEKKVCCHRFNRASCVHLTGHKITRRGDFMLHWAATHIFSSSLPHVTDSRNSRLSANLSQRSRTQKSMTISHQWWYWLNPVLIWLSVIPSHVHILQSTLKRCKQTLNSYIKYSVLLWSSSINKWVNAEFSKSQSAGWASVCISIAVLFTFWSLIWAGSLQWGHI